MKFTVILVLISMFNKCTFGYKVLLLMPAGPRSHRIFYDEIVKALSSNGHKVTVVSPFLSENLGSNVAQVKIPFNWVEHLFENSFDDNILQLTLLWIKASAKGCVDTFVLPDVQLALDKEYDLYLTSYGSTECYMPHIQKTKKPFVFIFPNQIYGMSDFVGNLDILSISPNLYYKFVYPMTFIERFQSTILTVYDNLMYRYLMVPMMEKESRKRGVIPPDDYTSFYEMMTNASGAVINSIRALENPPRPYPPNVIFAGGIHIGKYEGILDQKTLKWLDEASVNGFIYFSLGSRVKPSDMKPEHKEILMKTFGSLKQRILWKWNEEDIENLPSNVKISKWFPQQKILGHKNIRLFITHGGLLSMQEATYFKVPVIGLPIAIDNNHNLLQAENQGWAKMIEWDVLTQEKLKFGIHEMLSDKRVPKILSKRSELAKDSMKSARYELNWWLEYFIRHDGAPHLHPPFFTMYWFQIYNFDVWLLVILISVVSIWLSFRILRCLFRTMFCCRSKKHKKE